MQRRNPNSSKKRTHQRHHHHQMSLDRNTFRFLTANRIRIRKRYLEQPRTITDLLQIPHNLRWWDLGITNREKRKEEKIKEMDSTRRKCSRKFYANRPILDGRARSRRTGEESRPWGPDGEQEPLDRISSSAQLPPLVL